MMEKRRAERSAPTPAFAAEPAAVTYGRTEAAGSFVTPDFGAFDARPSKAEPPAPRRRSNAAGMALAAGGFFGTGLCLFLAFALSGGASKHPSAPDLSASVSGAATNRAKETPDMIAEPGPAVLRLGKRSAAVPDEPEEAPALYATRETARPDYYHSPTAERQTPPAGFYHDPFAPAPQGGRGAASGRIRPAPAADLTPDARTKETKRQDAAPETEATARRRELLKRMAEAEPEAPDAAEGAAPLKMPAPETPVTKPEIQGAQAAALAARLRRAAAASFVKTETEQEDERDEATLAGPRAVSPADFGAVEALVRSGVAPSENGTDAESDPRARASAEAKPSAAAGRVKVRQMEPPAATSDVPALNDKANDTAKAGGALPPGCAGRAFSSGGVDYFLDPESRRFYVVHQGPADVSKYSYAEYRRKSRTLMLVTTPGVKFDVGKPVREFSGELGKMREVGVVPAGGKFSDAKIFPLAVDAEQ